MRTICHRLQGGICSCLIEQLGSIKLHEGRRGYGSERTDDAADPPVDVLAPVLALAVVVVDGQVHVVEDVERVLITVRFLQVIFKTRNEIKKKKQCK